MSSLKLYFPKKKESVLRYYRTLSEFSGNSISTEIILALETARSIREWEKEVPKVFIPNDRVPEFLEFWKYLGVETIHKGKKPHPLYKFMWNDSLIVGWQSGELVEFLCTKESSQKQFQELCDKFVIAEQTLDDLESESKMETKGN